MSLVQLPPSQANGVDDNRSGNQSTPTPPASLDSLSVTSSSSAIHPGPVKLTARSCLYEICAQNHWNRPVFHCCNEEGPSNHKLFTYKVNIEIREDSNSKLVVECIGKPQLSKKAAADSAAEGVLWYLVHLGYPKKQNRSKKSS